MAAPVEVPGFIPIRQPIDLAKAVAYIETLSIPGWCTASGNGVVGLQANNGMSNPTYLLLDDHLRLDGGRKLIIRKNPAGKLLPGAHQIEREYRVMAALSGSKVPVPAVHALCSDDAVLGQVGCVWGPFFTSGVAGSGCRGW
jgi:aminoglycoside phosphotransferase (APT) family kinase protein